MVLRASSKVVASRGSVSDAARDTSGSVGLFRADSLRLEREKGVINF